MSEAKKRKLHSSKLKAKVGLEALRGRSLSPAHRTGGHTCGKRMKLKSKKQLQQTNAVAGIADCFAGQFKREGLNYRLDPGRAVDASAQAVAALETAGFKNADLALTPGQMPENIHAVQRRQNRACTSVSGCEKALRQGLETAFST